MRVSFIVTPSADGLSGSSAEALIASTLPGDEVIVVTTRDFRVQWTDLAALQGTAQAPETPGGGVTDGEAWRVVRLGAQPAPTIAVAANVGLSLASGEAVVFVSGDERLDPSGLRAARLLMARTQADVIVARFSGAGASDEDAVWEKPDRAAALWMAAHSGRMLLRRGFVRAAGLRHAEDLPALAVPQWFHWQVCLRAGDICFQDIVMVRAPDTQAPGPVPASAEERVSSFTLYGGMHTDLGPDGPHMALREWLARQVGRDLAALPPDEYWRYAEAAEPALLAGAWPTGRGGRALAALAARPLWQAVALWQAEALWRNEGGGIDQESEDFPPDWPQAKAASRAIGFWRGLRGGSDVSEGPDSARGPDSA